MSDSLLFMIEGSPMLPLVRQHIAEVLRVREANKQLLDPLHKEYGVERVSVDRENGTVLAVMFPKKVHPDFTKPSGRNRTSHPKKGTEWASKFAAQQGHEGASHIISSTLNIPLSIEYSDADGKGSRIIGGFFDECGFLYLSEEGPYAMWIPDVQAEVADDVKRGYTVEEPAASFKPEFPGCKRIEQEEWDILVAQHKLAEKKAKVAEPEGAAA